MLVAVDLSADIVSACEVRFISGLSFIIFRQSPDGAQHDGLLPSACLRASQCWRTDMKKEILVEDHPPREVEMLTLVVLPLAVAVLAGVTLTIFLW
jgi:hypothetical protein